MDYYLSGNRKVNLFKYLSYRKRSLSGSSMMRFKFGGERRNDWHCCFCCHVRTGTIFLGIWHLILHLMAFSYIALILWKPDVIMDYEYGSDESLVTQLRNKHQLPPALPTPLSSEVDPSDLDVLDEDETIRVDIDMGDGEKVHMESSIQIIEPVTDEPVDKKKDFELLKKERSYNPGYMSFRDPFGTRSITRQDMNTLAVVTFCTFIITILMVYGAVRNKPSYLMPFFCLQVFDFCIAWGGSGKILKEGSLTAVGYLCYLPDLSRLIAESHHIPLGAQLRQLNPQCLSILLVLTFLLAMTLKAYFIGVVWRCYKYLSLRRVAQLRMIPFIDAPGERLGAAVATDSPLSYQEALLLLPDYETAVSDPRYAPKEKKELDNATMTAPPPAYSSVVQDANQVVPEEAVQVVEIANERTVPTSPAHEGDNKALT
ncbi:hypothetical protein J437_LFUL014267 [Ladona fulva]|uniref:Lysosomal-associated transmembrane protein 4A n=1 Tax=Ladona fulva TaxID=123851 RepID=A0A8K0P6U7_LADFU|nr:hypothetical protein J437_LFUL014267 [Ladona fulva]